MLSRMPIRKKFLCVTVLLTGTLLLLLFSSLRGVYAYRQLAQMISQRAEELQTISKLQEEVDNLRFGFRIGNSPNRCDLLDLRMGVFQNHAMQVRQLDAVLDRLSGYKTKLNSQIANDPLLADRTLETALVRRIEDKILQMRRDRARIELASASDAILENDLEMLGQMVHELPTYLQDRMRKFRDEVRSRYRTWIGYIASSATATFVILGFSFWYFRYAVVQPFKILLAGSRSIASGQFEQQIELQSHDELAELANALNDMTRRFIEIRNNLNEKVQQRTREVVRSEQLASVGFLAAGVAHEINNPLASIAWSAEALEGRLHEILHVQCQSPMASLSVSPVGSPVESQVESQVASNAVNPAVSPAGGLSEGGAVGPREARYDEQELNVLRKYLKRIQDEAFRCKGITERLLDFSRLSESQRKQKTDVNESVADMIALVQHLGQYRNKHVEYIGEAGLIAWVSPPELKQVVLNLLTNALDSVDDGGLVTVSLEHDETTFTLTVRDNGCGMTPEVLNHLFEPFFTRRRDGRGTGLGLSITYRIVQDHAGELLASSDGPGMGSKFILTLPLEKTNSQSHETVKAAA